MYVCECACLGMLRVCGGGGVSFFLPNQELRMKACQGESFLLALVPGCPELCDAGRKSLS